MPKVNAKRIALSVAVILGVAVAVYFIGEVLSINLGRSGSAEDPARDDQFVSGGLRIANRDHFAVCVDTHQLDSEIVQEVLPSITQALTEASQDARWSSSVGSIAPTVDVGCPAGPEALAPEAETTSTGAILAVGIISEQASPFKVFLFVTPENVIENLFDGAPPIATQERLRRSEHLFTTVTFAIFVSPSQAADLDFLRTAFLVGAEVNETNTFFPLLATPVITPQPEAPTPQTSDSIDQAP